MEKQLRMAFSVENDSLGFSVSQKFFEVEVSERSVTRDMVEKVWFTIPND
jgi:hypothetical protein